MPFAAEQTQKKCFACQGSGLRSPTLDEIAFKRLTGFEKIQCFCGSKPQNAESNETGSLQKS